MRDYQREHNAATLPILIPPSLLLPYCSPRSHLASVENLAARLIPVAVESGEQVIRQGDHGDRFYVVAEGPCHRRVRRRAGPRRGPRRVLRRDRAAAGHAADRDGRTRPSRGLLYALEREAFVSGVTNNPRSAIAADDVIEERLAPV